ncbi:MAG: SRPBCC domain-containing protein [Candidatus Paceibacterota bacterium]|jgi:uncharacterized protein YndB with AHSA1/START domain
MAIEKSDLIVTYQFNAPPAKVWKAWTHKNQIKKWWGPDGFVATHIEIDLRVGGKYLYCIRGVNSPGGKERDFWRGGVFRDISSPDSMQQGKIVMIDSFTDEKGNKVPASYYGMNENFPLEMMIAVTFKEEDGDTKLTLQCPDVGGISSDDLFKMKEGWKQSLRKLEKVL